MYFGLIIRVLTVLAVTVGPNGQAKEESLASVGPDSTLLKLGCSIANALKDPTAEERCGRLQKKQGSTEEKNVWQQQEKSQTTAKAKAAPAG